MIKGLTGSAYEPPVKGLWIMASLFLCRMIDGGQVLTLPLGKWLSYFQASRTSPSTHICLHIVEDYGARSVMHSQFTQGSDM